MALYSFALYLAYQAAGFPVGILSLIWPQICEKMTVAVPYISLMRAMIAAGGVSACILSGKLQRKREKLLDLCIAGVGLEALGVLGFSLSRLFWHLMVWAFVLGMGFGVSLTLLSLAVAIHGRKCVFFQYSGIGVGILAGSWLVSTVLSASGSWREACQILAVVQVLIVAAAFLLRRLLMREPDLRKKLEEDSRKQAIDREREKNSRRLTEEELGKAEKAFMKRTVMAAAASFLTCLLLLCITLWPQSYRVVDTAASAEMTGYGIVAEAAGLAAGYIFFGIMPLSEKNTFRLSMGMLIILFLAEAYLIHLGALSGNGILIFQLLCGASAFPVFPQLVLLDDIRLDREAELSLISLFPAFGLGSWIAATPLTLALVGSGQSAHFPLWLLAITAGLCVCLIFSEREGKG